eukprot:282044-Pyramimonas_sp.AAC.1
MGVHERTPSIGNEEIKPKKKGKKKKKIVVSLVNCCYPIVKNAVKNRPGWRTAEPGEPWDVGWSDTNWVVREVRDMNFRPSQMYPVQR